MQHSQLDALQTGSGGRSRSRRMVVALVAAMTVVATCGAGLLAAPTASAASYGYVYISLPKWMGNCSPGGSVSIISGTVDGVSTVSMDRGDDLVYMRVRLNDANRVQFTAYCNRWPGYWQPGFTQVINPTRNNQTWWIGPAGVTRN